MFCEIEEELLPVRRIFRPAGTWEARNQPDGVMPAAIEAPYIAPPSARHGERRAELLAIIEAHPDGIAISRLIVMMGQHIEAVRHHLRILSARDQVHPSGRGPKVLWFPGRAA